MSNDLYKIESSRGFTGQLVIHNEKLKQIQKTKTKMSKEEIFRIPRTLGFLRRKNEIIYCVSTKEMPIDISQTKGDIYLPLLTKEELTKQLNTLKSEDRAKITTVHLGAVKVILTAHFQDGINSPIKMALIDNRIKNRKDCIIGAARGNLAYGKFMFSVYPKFRIDLKTANLSKVLSFVHEFERQEFMEKGDKVFSITYLVAYALSNSVHSIEYAKSEYIELDEIFSDIGNVEKNDFCELFPEEDDWTIDLNRDKHYLGNNDRFRPSSSGTKDIELNDISKKLDQISNSIGYNRPIIRNV